MEPMKIPADVAALEDNHYLDHGATQRIATHKLTALHGLLDT